MDVSIEEDLIEEVVRTQAATTPSRRRCPPTPSNPGRAGRRRAAVARIRGALEGAGFSEAVNFSFVAARELEPFGYAVVTGDGSGRALGVALKNPISADLAVMRTSLVPSLLKNAVTNRRQRVEDLRLYEIARTYRPARSRWSCRRRSRSRWLACSWAAATRSAGRSAATPSTSTTPRRP